MLCLEIKTKEAKTMKLSKATLWLKGVLGFSAVMLALVVFGGIPGYLRHVFYVRPDLIGWDYWMRGYGLLLALPVWAALALLWRVFDTIPQNNGFTFDNVRRFVRMRQLAATDLALVALLGVFLISNGITPPFLMGSLMLALFVGIVAAIVFHVLAGLVRNAAELKQDSDMTI